MPEKMNGVTTPDAPAPVPPHKTKVVRVPVDPNSGRALAMLTLMPVFATPVPRLHVAPKAPDGRLTVYDRALGESFVVYTPRFRAQFQDGHRAGQWYVRMVSDVGTAIGSLGFPTARAAIGALENGAWRIAKAPRAHSAARFRVIWTASLSATGS